MACRPRIPLEKEEGAGVGWGRAPTARGGPQRQDTFPPPREGLNLSPASFVWQIELKSGVPRQVVFQRLQIQRPYFIRNADTNRSYLKAENPNFVHLGKHWGFLGCLHFLSPVLSSQDASGCSSFLSPPTCPPLAVLLAVFASERLKPLALVRKV